MFKELKKIMCKELKYGNDISSENINKETELIKKRTK